MVSKEAQREVLDINDNVPTQVAIPNTKKVYRIGWLKPDTTNRITRGVLRDDLPTNMKSSSEVIELMGKKNKLLSQLASYIILNSYWKNRFAHWLHWRWLYYVKEYDFNQLFVVVLEGKKKMPADGYYMSMALLVSMMDTMKTMTTKEVEQYLAELSLATNPPSEKSTLGQ
jgi:hypothetical protein